MDKYKESLKIAEEKYNNGKLRLCPRGYATAKTIFKVYPSAYANGYATQVCSGNKPDYKGIYNNDYKVKEIKTPKTPKTPKTYKKDNENNDLKRWFDEKWINVCEYSIDGNGNKIYKPCGRSNATLIPEDYPYCRPMYKLPKTTVKSLNELSTSDINKMCKYKKSLKQGIDNKPTRIFISKIINNKK